MKMSKYSINYAQNTQKLLKILKYKEKKCDIIFLIIKRKKIIKDVINLKKMFDTNKFKFV
jgi:hypothetical protein